jgi:hypothetical protein
VDAGGLLDAGSVFVYSGRNGAILRRFDGSAIADYLGFSVACGRVDRDNVPDIVIGGVLEETPPPDRFERVWIFSGQSGALLQHIQQPARGDHFGFRLALCETRSGKVTALLVGAPFADPNENDKAGTLWQYPIVKTK